MVNIFTADLSKLQNAFLHLRNKYKVRRKCCLAEKLHVLMQELFFHQWCGFVFVDLRYLFSLVTEHSITLQIDNVPCKKSYKY